MADNWALPSHSQHGTQLAERVCVVSSEALARDPSVLGKGQLI